MSVRWLEATSIEPRLSPFLSVSDLERNDNRRYILLGICHDSFGHLLRNLLSERRVYRDGDVMTLSGMRTESRRRQMSTHWERHSWRRASHRAWCQTLPRRIAVWDVRHFDEYICQTLERSSGAPADWTMCWAAFVPASICQLRCRSKWNFTMPSETGQRSSLSAQKVSWYRQQLREGKKLSLFVFTHTSRRLSHWGSQTAP